MIGEVRYCDCMDPDRGLTTIPSKSYEVCLTDPPYNVKFKGKDGNYGKVYFHEHKLYYFDEMTHEEYWTLNMGWFGECMRICNAVIFTPGTPALYDWIRYKKPDYSIRGWYKPNDECYNSFDPILMYGKVKNISRWGMSVWKSPKKCNLHDFPEILIHPAVKQYDIWRRIVEKLDPGSILDPFLGSGTTAQAGEEFGIPYLGYEKIKEYKVDIDKRIAYGRKQRGQKSLVSFATQPAVRTNIVGAQE